jgi:hypothetical protein
VADFLVPAHANRGRLDVAGDVVIAMDPSSERNVLVFKTREDALAPIGPDPDATNAEAWERWLRGHLNIERAEIFNTVAEQMAEFASEYVGEKLQPLRSEIADLRRTLAERDERTKALGELRHELAGERVEREALQLSSALAARDAKIAALEDRLQMLLKFLNVSGYDLPRGM